MVETIGFLMGENRHATHRPAHEEQESNRMTLFPEHASKCLQECR
jgi:hypothetical protein